LSNVGIVEPPPSGELASHAPTAPSLPRRGLSEVVTVVLFSGASMATALVANRVVTHVIRPEALGELYLLNNIGQWLTIPTTSVYVYVMRHWALARASRTMPTLVNGMLWGLALQAAIAALGIVACLVFGVSVLTAWGAVALWLFCLALSVAQGFGPIQAMERRRVLAGVQDLLGNPARQVALAIAGAIWLNLGATGLLWTQAIVGLGSAGVILYLFKKLVATSAEPSREPSPQVETEAHGIDLKTVVTYSIPFLITGALIQLATSAERWRLASIASPSATAVFVQASSLSTAMVAATTVLINNYFYPIVTQEASASIDNPIRGAARSIRRMGAAAFAVLSVTVLVVTFFSRLIAHLLFGPRFQAVTDLLPWTTLGAALFGFGQFLAVFPYVARDPVGPNVAVMVSSSLYSLILFNLHPSGDAPLEFAHALALGQGVYVVAMIFVAARAIRRARARTAS
jgi:O-antigen/teichoic acid export membrane protein